MRLLARVGVTGRVTHPDGSPAPEFYGTTLGGGAIVLGTGNPGDQGVNYGVLLPVWDWIFRTGDFVRPLINSIGIALSATFIAVVAGGIVLFLVALEMIPAAENDPAEGIDNRKERARG